MDLNTYFSELGSKHQGIEIALVMVSRDLLVRIILSTESSSPNLCIVLQCLVRCLLLFTSISSLTWRQMLPYGKWITDTCRLVTTFYYLQWLTWKIKQSLMQQLNFFDSELQDRALHQQFVVTPWAQAL